MNYDSASSGQRRSGWMDCSETSGASLEHSSIHSKQMVCINPQGFTLVIPVKPCTGKTSSLLDIAKARIASPMTISAREARPSFRISDTPAVNAEAAFVKPLGGTHLATASTHSRNNGETIKQGRLKRNYSIRSSMLLPVQTEVPRLPLYLSLTLTVVG